MIAPATSDAHLGLVLADKYRIVRELGRGGMGVVYEAEHLQLGGRVAVKVMLEKYANDGEAIARFQREAIAANRIGDPHIIQVMDVGFAPNGQPYVVMELLHGLSLSKMLEQTGPMAPWRAIAIMRQVLHAVGAAHAKGTIHRDLKPDNIFLVQQGGQHDFVKLLDFGISKLIDPNEQVAFTKLTSTGVVMGTPLYMAPEQAMGQQIDRAADIYACGVILYEMLAGKPPFEGATYAVLVAKLLTQPPEYLANVRGGLPLALVNAVHRALEKDPAQRFASAEQFAASLPGDRTVSEIELAGTLDSGLAFAQVAPPARPTSRGTWIAIGGALVAGIATAAVLIATLTRGTPEPPAQASQTDGSQQPPAPQPQPIITPVPTGALDIRTAPAGAHITVRAIAHAEKDGPAYAGDPEDVGTSPVEVRLAAGAYEVTATLAGHAVYTTKTQIEPQTKTQLELPLAVIGKKIVEAPRVIRTPTPAHGPTSAGPQPPIKPIGKQNPNVAPPPNVKNGPAPINPGLDSKGNPYTPRKNPYPEEDDEK